MVAPLQVVVKAPDAAAKFIPRIVESVAVADAGVARFCTPFHTLSTGFSTRLSTAAGNGGGSGEKAAGRGRGEAALRRDAALLPSDAMGFS